MPGRISPSITRVRITTPRYGSYQESKISAFSGASAIARRRRQPMDDRFENFANAHALFGAGENRAGVVEADDLADLPARFVGLRAGQVDLVDDRNDLEVVVGGEVRVRQRLRLDALRRIDEQQRALAGGQRPRHFVRKIHVPGRVDEIEDVVLAVERRVVQPDGVRLDRDAALALEVHASRGPALPSRAPAARP